MDYLEAAKQHLVECPEDTVELAAELITTGMLWLQYREMSELARKALEKDASADLEKILTEYSGAMTGDILSQVEDNIDKVLLRTGQYESVSMIQEDMEYEGTTTD